MIVKAIALLFNRPDSRTHVFPVTSSRICLNALRWVAALGFLAACIDGAEIPFPEVLDKAAVVQEKITDIDREGLVIGNGDLSGILWQRDGGLCLRVTKNDVWDARVDTSRDPAMMTVDIPNQKWSGGTGSPHSYQTPYPQPRCPALIRIGGSGPATGWSVIRAGGKSNEWLLKDGHGVMAVEGTGAVSAGYRYTLGKAVEGRFDRLSFRISGSAGAQYYVNIYDSAGKALVESGWKDSPATEAEVSFPIATDRVLGAIELYVQSTNGSRAENRIRELTLTGPSAPLVIPVGMPAAPTGGTRLDLRRAVATAGETTVRALAGRNVFLIETKEAVTIEEIKAAELPAAAHGETEGVRWLHAKFPGDADYAGMQYAMAVATAGKHKAVSLVTSWQTKGDVREAAIALARETVNGAIPELIAGHEAEWVRFWSASGVDLADPDFQLWWYRMAYFLRCFSKPGVNPAGLWGVMVNDTPQWHGDYHHNYNAWQPFWSAMILNQPGLAEPWIDYMNQMLPRMRWLAKTTYDCEGAFVGISSFAFEPDPAVCTSVNKRQSMLTPWGYTIGMIGMSAQVLWHHHLYQPDRRYLESKIWPVLREAALFFASFAEKCPRDAAGKAVYGPSYSPEHGNFGVSNVPFDLAYARFTLKAAIRAAGELGEKPDLTTRFRAALDMLPAYPTAPDAQGRPVVVDWTGCRFGEIGEHNITVPAVPVFPGEQVTWFSPQSEKDLLLNTIRQIRHRGANATVMLSVAKARLSMPEALAELRDFYRPNVLPNGMFYWPLHGFYLSESVGVAAAISEFLLQSVDDTIRVFPCWPKDKDARFKSLRAQGGFLVSAEQKGGKVTLLEITPTVDGRLRMVDPWTGKITEHAAVAGKTLRFTPQQALPKIIEADKRIPRPSEAGDASPVTVACYYFGNYHPNDPRNEKAKGPGWSEWELVKAAKPRFPSHHQPNVPLWGYTDESDPKVMERKIDAAADHGIDAFLFDWYYYNDGPFLDRPIDEGFLKAANHSRLKFAFMWANHDWEDIHPYRRGAPRKLLYPGAVTPENFEKIGGHVIKNYFRHPSYWKIDGRPYFSIYDLSKLLEGFGSVEATRAALDHFRAKTVDAGLPGLHLNAVVWGTPILPAEKTPADPVKLVKDLGFDSVTSYVWIHHVPLPKQQTPYDDVRDQYFAYAEAAGRKFGLPYYPNVTMGWDSSPRAHQDDPFDASGYPFMNTIGGNTPDRFKEALALTKQRLMSRPPNERILNINCWNEWTEGSYLEPDKVHGMKYLEAVKEVFGN